MHRLVLVGCVTAVVVTSPVSAQELEDVVHLKNGGVVRGTIIEQVEGESLRIETAGGNVFAYTMEEIAEITREPVPATEPAAGGVEIGTLFGFSRISSGDDALTMLGLPGALGNGNPALYVSWFPSDKLAIGTDFSVTSLWSNGSSSASFYLGGRTEFFPQGSARSGVYILGQGALVAGTGHSDNQFAAGAGIGERWRLGPVFVVRAELRYRRWFRGRTQYYGLLGYDPDDTHEISVVIGLGARLGVR